jgi:sortase (surface protein transpeptidase)
MTYAEVKKLHSGDEVYWNDPDEGTASRVYKIRTIEVIGEIVVITDSDGSHLECFAKELS